MTNGLLREFESKAFDIVLSLSNFTDCISTSLWCNWSWFATLNFNPLQCSVRIFVVFTVVSFTLVRNVWVIQILLDFPVLQYWCICNYICFFLVSFSSIFGVVCSLPGWRKWQVMGKLVHICLLASTMWKLLALFSMTLTADCNHSNILLKWDRAM